MLIPKRVLPIGRVAAKENGRYMINGVFLERTKDGAPRACATDGRRLLIVCWPEDDPEKFPKIGELIKHTKNFNVVIPLDLWNEAGRAIPEVSPRPILQNFLVEESAAKNKAKMIEMLSFDGETTRHISRSCEDAKFPPPDKVVPDYRKVRRFTRKASSNLKTPAIEISFYPHLLAGLLDAIGEILGSPGEHPVKLIVPMDPTQAMRIEGKRSDGTEVCGVIMPTAPEEDR